MKDTPAANPWLEPLPSPGEMRAWDAAATALCGLRPELLMENASREAFAALREELARRGLPLRGLRALAVAGPGNNGGDAAAVARHLLDAGAEVLLAHTRPRGAYTGAAGYHFRVAADCGVAMRRARRPADLAMADGEPPDAVIDGLLGTGISGELRPETQALVERINVLGRRALVLAVDIPSGLNGLTGRPSPVAVKAHATATFEALKCGMAQPEARPFLGRAHVRPIGIPRQVKGVLPTAAALLTDGVAALLPDDGPDLHKGTAGKVLVAGGSEGLTGAPLLAALGALRGGGGLVSAACPGGLADVVKAGNPDVMILPLGPVHRPTRAWSAALADELAPRLEHFDALAVGPGLGRDAGARDFLARLLAMDRPPTVLDADALTILAQEPELLKALTDRDVLTPHPGEAARLLGISTDAVQADRVEACRGLGALSPAVTVLKGAASLIHQRDTQGGGLLCVSPHCRPTLAVGGSGDVLAGLVAALLARGLPPRQAACLGVYWHGQAGAELETDFPHRGNTAGDIAAALPRAMKTLKERNRPC